MPEADTGWDFLIKDLMNHFTNPYLQTPEMQELFALETCIIDHHTSATGGVRWARQHSVAQQIAAQDIGRYYLDVLLRPDHPYNLIAHL
ncbi:hypothetical protein BDW62DRAFT_207280 [Aspergillus aurantiobrunneus]